METHEFFVRLGEYDWKEKSETRYIDFKVSAFRNHPDYDKPTHSNDIAVVRLRELTEYNPFIRPVCMPDVNMPVYTRDAVVSGEKNYLENSISSYNTGFPGPPSQGEK